MATIKEDFLDYPGLTQYHTQNKNYIDTKDKILSDKITAIEEIVGGIDITVSGNTLLIGYVYNKTGALVDFNFTNSKLVIDS